MRTWIRETRIAVGSWRYAGFRYEDPICGRHFRRLLTSSTGAKDAWCPYCWSAERHRILWLFLTRELGIEEQDRRVLHVAPERGIGRRLRKLSHLNYTAIDLAGREGALRADLTDLPFRDAAFDLVICSHVLEHIPDDRTAIAETARVLRPGGLAIMQHPIDRKRAHTYEDWSVVSPEQKVRAFFQRDHVRIYGRDIEARLREYFEVEHVDYGNQLPPLEQERFRLKQVPGADPTRDLEADAIYICQV